MPYVTPAKVVAYGALAMSLSMIGDEVGPPPDHTAKFMGDCPCAAEGKPLVIVTGSGNEDFGRGVLPSTRCLGDRLSQIRITTTR